MDQPVNISELFDKYLRNQCTPEEAATVLQWLAENGSSPEFKSNIRSFLGEETSDDIENSDALEQILRKNEKDILERIGQLPETKSAVQMPRLRQYFSIAAAILILMGVGVYLMYFSKTDHSEQPSLASVSKKDSSGDNKAILTLASGEKIVLDNEKDGELANEGNVRVIKLNGQLSYQSAGHPQKLTYNTISTPRGCQYVIELADGTHVWLNAASSLRFPTFFTGDKRTVELTGEGYFEVAENKDQPFIVQASTVAVTVLGTHFNVMAYADEPSIKTTLIEGSVNVSEHNKSVLLKPGQQASVKDQSIRLADNIDIDEVMAWKRGYFQFERGANIKKVMRQIERWYDVEIVYDGAMPSRHFGGKISRTSKLEDVLKMMELNKINYKMEGKKITIMP